MTSKYKALLTLLAAFVIACAGMNTQAFAEVTHLAGEMEEGHYANDAGIDDNAPLLSAEESLSNESIDFPQLQAYESSQQEERPVSTEQPIVADDPAVLQSLDSPSATIDSVVTVHVSKFGWQDGCSGSAVAGTVGQALAIEALRVSLVGESIPADSSIEYRVWVANLGWQGWVTAGNEAGTTGSARAIEAIQFRLTGSLAKTHDLWYQAHVSTVGWMACVKNGASAGAINHGLPIEALRVWVCAKESEAPSGSPVSASAKDYTSTGISIRPHVANIGWCRPVGDGQLAGTTGQGLPVEALSISVDGDLPDGGVEYETHVATLGWQPAVSNGAIAGTTGQGLPIEALRMRLTGELANVYDLYYRAHVSQVGWLTWAKNGEDAGSYGMALSIEAVQACLVPKTVTAPVAADANFSSPLVTPSTVIYEAHEQEYGWCGKVSDGTTAGITGQGLRLEALTATLDSNASSLPGSIRYRSHLADIGWQDWRENNALSGTTGQGRRLEALEFALAGKVAEIYDVWYRAHVEDFGWLGWARNGETAGSTGISKRVEAFELRLVPKSSSVAPGSTDRHYIGPEYYWDAMTRKAQDYSSSTGQLILVNLSEHRVGIYENSPGYWRRIRYFACSSGAPSTPTVRGVFHIGSRGYVFGSGFSCYYWTQFYGDYLFHSVLYHQGTRIIQDGRLGLDISHGCVRLAIADAQYINENIRTGTTVVVYA